MGEVEAPVTQAGRRYAWIGSLAALALDILLLAIPLFRGHGGLSFPSLRAVAALAGIPAVQIGMVLLSDRIPGLKWAVIGVSVVWFVVIVLVTYESALIYAPSGGLWIIGAVDRPKGAWPAAAASGAARAARRSRGGS